MASLLAIMTALADQIRDQIDVDGLEVYPTLQWNPTPPAVDIYPADPFQNAITFGAGSNEILLLVRARVNTPDHEGAQETLLDLMDPGSGDSIEQAVADDSSLGNIVEDAAVTAGPSNYGIFTDPSGAGAFLGCTWTVTVTP